MTQAQEATYISLKAETGKETDLSDFLIGGGAIVEETEPATLLWFALQLDSTTFGIFNLFPDEAGRDAHFSGKVAAALNEKSAELVQGGWDQGVVSNIENSKVLTAITASELPPKVEEATFIRLTANPGKETDLANFLIGGGKLVEETEPATLYWFALQIDEKTFGIFDFFPDNAGRDAHFAGKVAAALNENAAKLVQGGWEESVLANVKNFKVLKACL